MRNSFASLARLLPGRLLAALLALACAPAQAGSFVWKVQDDQGDTHWLIGTVHMLSNDAYPLPSAYQTAYQSADGLIFESDLETMRSKEFQAIFMAEAGSEAALSTTIAPELNGELQKSLQEMGMPVAYCEPYRAWFCAATMELVSLMRVGLRPEFGVDEHFFQRARNDGKAVEWFEAPEEQVAILSGGADGDNTGLLEMALSNMQTPGERPSDVIGYWRDGKLDAMAGVVTTMRDEDEKTYESLLRDRNRAWVKDLRKRFRTDDRHWLIVVGAAHMFGPDGLPALLRAEGYTVTAVDP